MIVVVFLLALAMLGLLSVFDASARINKSESDVADAQGAVRYGVYSMTRAIRMAGSGGLYVTQAVLNHADPSPGLPGITVTNSADPNSYDNVEDPTTVTPLTGDPIKVRPGTDMIEVRGVINSPLIGFDLSTGCTPDISTPCDPATGCAPCKGKTNINAAATTNTPHVNDDTLNRPQFSQVDAYTAGAAQNPMLVLVAFNDDAHPGCSMLIGSQTYPLYPQLFYNVGTIKQQTQLVAGKTFGPVDFDDSVAREFNSEKPADAGTGALALKNVRHAGILDDLVFFIDNTDPLHPALAQGTRRGDKFDVVTLADEVEDMQIAYGVDKDALGAPGYGAINRKAAAAAGADTNVSSEKDGDEWVPNVAGETAYAATDFFDQPNDCPRLHSVMISLVAKSHDPDPTYRAPAARGLVTMNSPLLTAPAPNPRSYTGLPVTSFRRRVQTLKINMRNYAYEGG
jgi:hypothetical protein